MRSSGIWSSARSSSLRSSFAPAVFGPFGPSGRPDPRLIDIAPKPDVFFLWMYGALALLPAELETPADSDRPWNRDRGAAAPAIHFRHRRKELEASAFRRARRRFSWPAASSPFTWLALQPPWSPSMTA